MATTLTVNIPDKLHKGLSSILKNEHLPVEEYFLRLLNEDISVRVQKCNSNKTSIIKIFDIATSCQDTDLSGNHNKYLYGDNF